MKKKLPEVIEYRKRAQHKQSNELILELVTASPDDPQLNYQCAWSYDLLGEEEKAVPFYEKSIKLGLSGTDLAGALLGLGSTYRTMGKYRESQTTLLKGINLFPDNNALQVFYAMTLYNLKEHQAAMEILLRCLVETSSDKEVLTYKRAIEFYSDKLDETWS